MNNNSSSQSKPLAVIKVGGDVLLNQAQREGLAQNILDLHELNWNVIILHGGGPQVNALQKQLGITPNKVAGRRITSETDLTIVKQAIAGEVNVNLVSLLRTVGLSAFGCHGASGLIIEAQKRPPMIVSGEGDTPIDFGEVGDVVSINTELLSGLLQLNQIPVVATLGMDSNGSVYNINADTTVIEITRSLKADLLLLITEVGGIYRDINDADSLITSINPEKIKALINEGIITDGMIPKVEEAVKLLVDGIDSIVIASADKRGLFKAIARNKKNDAEIRATRICSE